jgi:hypothetical protein
MNAEGVILLLLNMFYNHWVGNILFFLCFSKLRNIHNLVANIILVFFLCLSLIDPHAHYPCKRQLHTCFKTILSTWLYPNKDNISLKFHRCIYMHYYINKCICTITTSIVSNYSPLKTYIWLINYQMFINVVYIYLNGTPMGWPLWENITTTCV